MRFKYTYMLQVFVSNVFKDLFYKKMNYSRRHGGKVVCYPYFGVPRAHTQGDNTDLQHQYWTKVNTGR